MEGNGDQRNNDDGGLGQPVQIRPDVIHSPPHSIASGNSSRWICEAASWERYEDRSFMWLSLQAAGTQALPLT
jgi:hypothetical protein